MHFEAALNLLWVALGVIALALTVLAALARRDKPHTGRNASLGLHVVGVCLVVLTLFPYISATDDMVRIEHFCAETGCPHSSLPGNHNQTNNLIRLYQTMETSVVCTVPEVVLVFFFVCLVFAPAPRPIERIQPREAGRSPPAFA